MRKEDGIWEKSGLENGLVTICGIYISSTRFDCVYEGFREWQRKI